MAQSSSKRKAPTKVVKPPSVAEIRDGLNVAFAAIGKTMPFPSTNNLEPTIWEYFVAKHLQSYAKARAEQAFDACVEAEALPDTKKEPQAPGTELAFEFGDHLLVTLMVKRPGERYNVERLCDYLEKNGVPLRIITQAREQAKYYTSPAHEFRPILK